MKTKDINIKFVEGILKGKTISHHDSWDGSLDYLDINKVDLTNDKKYVKFISWGYENIYIPVKYLSELMLTGKYTEETEIDHCYVRRTWNLYNK